MATAVLGDKIIVIGGWLWSADFPYATVQMYDPETDVWTIEGDAPFLKACSSTSVVNNRIYVIGGTNRPHPCLATSTIYELTINPSPPDFNGDGIIDATDMCIMVDYWDTDNSLCDIGPMPWGDGIVDVEDLKVLTIYFFEEVNDPTLITHWPLDETLGVVAYNNVISCDGNLIGDPVWQPEGGIVGGALQFDGKDDYVSTDFFLNPSDGEFSVVAWIKGGEPGQVLMSQLGTSNWLKVNTQGNLMTELKTTGRSAGPLPSQAIVTDGFWHRVGLVWDGSNRMLYVDGIIVAEDTPNGLVDSNNNLYIGCGKSMESGTFFSGLIDDIRIYNRVVSP
jgi:hypothetical protein